MSTSENSQVHDDWWKSRLSCQPAAPEQYDEFFRLMLEEASEYLDHTLKLMQITQGRFRELFETIGRVFAINYDDRVAGFYWFEARGETLHLHGLVLGKEFQGKGIGSKILASLEENYRSSMKVIELGVHQSNTGARRLYEKFGYRAVRELPELGFEVLQKHLSERGW